jgi:hypothetical protein
MLPGMFVSDGSVMRLLTACPLMDVFRLHPSGEAA